jgi:hypothetical protein
MTATQRKMGWPPSNPSRCWPMLVILSGMDPVTLAAVSQLVSSGRWEVVRDLLRRGDRTGASAEVDGALAEIHTDQVAALDERTKEDVRYQVLSIAGIDERPLLSAVLGMQSAEKVGENLVRATWALVTASGALVLATVVLVIITALKS